MLLSVLESQVQARAVVVRGFRFGSKSAPVWMRPGVSLDLTLSSVLVWRKLINSPAVQILFCYGHSYTVSA